MNDLGLLRSYSVFDYFRVIGGKPIFIPYHIERLRRSAELFNLPLEYSQRELSQACFDLISRNNCRDAGLRIVLTGGDSEGGYLPHSPNVFMLLHPLPVYAQSLYINGARLITAEYQRVFSEVKTTVYHFPIMLKNQMAAAEAIEVLYYSNDFITECSRSNIFFIDKKGVIHTPGNNILAGITRKVVLQICEGILPFSEREIQPGEMSDMRECFIASSTKSVMPIISIDDQAVGNGQVGPVTKAIMTKFGERVKAELASA